MASNQLRLWFGAFAYYLVERLRSLALRGTQLERATVGTIRLRMLKVGAPNYRERSEGLYPTGQWICVAETFWTSNAGLARDVQGTIGDLASSSAARLGWP